MTSDDGTRADSGAGAPERPGPDSPARPAVPFSLRVRTFAAMLDIELVDHPVYHEVHLQWFRDRVHGTGMLAFLSRREDGRIDYYAEPGLHLDRSGYEVGAGVRTWSTVTFDRAYLKVADDGVSAHVRFTDVDGRLVEVEVCDRNGVPRTRGAMLAPVGASTTDPPSFMAVWLPSFDLVRHVDGYPPVVRIGGKDATVAALPGERLHERYLVKYSAPVVTVDLNHDDDVLAGSLGDAELEQTPDGSLRALRAHRQGHSAALTFCPPFPANLQLPAQGSWRLRVDRQILTGGTWTVHPLHDDVDLRLRVTRPWRPRHLPALLRIITTTLSVFRHWPLTYSWRAALLPDGTVAAAAWSRTGTVDPSSHHLPTRAAH